jgi:hypothetical protein
MSTKRIGVTLKQRLENAIKINPENGCHEWQLALSVGYGTISIKNRSYRAHRIAWSVYNEREIPEGMVIMHTCDNPKCINPEHLQLGTVADNNLDKKNKGRQSKIGRKFNPPSGTLNGRAKLNEDTIRLIRAEVGLNQRELADKYGITSAVMNKIVNFKLWKHVK